VWLDTNGNGQQDTGEAGVQGVKVTLLDASGNPVGRLAHHRRQRQLPLHGPQARHLQRPVRQDHAAGRLQLHHPPTAGSDATDSDANSLDGKTIQTVLDSGESDRSWDAGIVANPGAITGTVLEDLDHDGTGDTPIAGVTVVLKDASGAPIATTTTDANGNYSFANVRPVTTRSNKPTRRVTPTSATSTAATPTASP
jgi:serine-aspartate repeat-containing protein C/D/E